MDGLKTLRRHVISATKKALLIEELGEDGYKIWKNLKTQTQREGIQLLFPYGTTIY